MKLPREKIASLIGMDDSQWESAAELEFLLEMVNQQRTEDIDAKYGFYPRIARLMWRYTFGRSSGCSQDSKRKALWYFGVKVGFNS